MVNSHGQCLRNRISRRMLYSRIPGVAALRASRWFTRGWTLQELIAPASVEFFSLQLQWLGDKRTLEQLLHDITGIPLDALQGEPLANFSVNERMRWAENRQTTEEE